jgi:SsrA-binding protein
MTDKKPAEGTKIIAENRRALARYTIDERVEVGVVLVGSEVKSLRAGRMELGDAYAIVQNGQLVLLNAYIAPYAFATMIKHEEKRTRRLLAHRAEIDRLEGKITQRGYTLVATKAYFKDGRVKIELGLARGKENADRREEIKKREGDREARAAMTRGMKR